MKVLPRFMQHRCDSILMTRQTVHAGWLFIMASFCVLGAVRLIPTEYTRNVVALLFFAALNAGLGASVPRRTRRT